jgi:hypothetical protein
MGEGLGGGRVGGGGGVKGLTLHTAFMELTPGGRKFWSHWLLYLVSIPTSCSQLESSKKMILVSAPHDAAFTLMGWPSKSIDVHASLLISNGFAMGNKEKSLAKHCSSE